MKAIRLLVAVLLWALVVSASMLPIAAGWVRAPMEESHGFSNGMVIQATMAGVSVALALGLTRGRLGRYGFKLATGGQIKTTLIAGSIAAVAVHIALALIWTLRPPSGQHPVMAGSSFFQIVIMVWIIASICEEVLHRGLVQGLLEPLRDWGLAVSGVRLSVPVIVAAVLFGAVHIMLLTMGTDSNLVAGIVGSAIILGLVAGYYREKTGSLIPAILVHMLFNVFGGVSMLVQRLLV